MNHILGILSLEIIPIILLYPLSDIMASQANK